MPVVVDAVEIETPVAAFEATPAPVGAVAVEAHVEPPAPAPAPDIVDDILELATADPSAVEPLVDLELGAPETGSPLESLVLLELGDASAPAAMAPVDVALSAAVSLPELELLELTPLPEPPAVVVSPEPIAAAPALFEAEPHRSDAASAYDVTREAESPRSGRASKGRRKGKAAAAKTSPVAALEHLLRRVETRRAEITSESVA